MKVESRKSIYNSPFYRACIESKGKCVFQCRRDKTQKASGVTGGLSCCRIVGVGSSHLHKIRVSLIQKSFMLFRLSPGRIPHRAGPRIPGAGGRPLSLDYRPEALRSLESPVLSSPCLFSPFPFFSLSPASSISVSAPGYRGLKGI